MNNSLTVKEFVIKVLVLRKIRYLFIARKSQEVYEIGYVFINFSFVDNIAFLSIENSSFLITEPMPNASFPDSLIC